MPARLLTDSSERLLCLLQKNKVKRAVEIFDMVETVDSISLAEKIDHHCSKIKRTMSVLIEINSGREPQKAGVLPENAEELIREISSLQHLNVQGLMTMGPRFGDPEQARPYFRAEATVRPTEDTEIAAC